LALAPGSPPISGLIGSSGSWVSAFRVLGFWTLGSGSGPLLGPKIHSSESFAPSRTGIEYWRLLLSVFGYRLISDFIFPETSFAGIVILSDIALRNTLYLANVV
jgi:hypothetical protein